MNTNNKKLLWDKVKNILWEKWDPIGVYEPNAAWSDEYDSYVPYIYSLAVEGATQQQIANALTQISSDTIGLTAQMGNEHDYLIAGMLVAAKNACLG
nr:hypothetical protein [uncultured Shewanella sp.]